MKEPPKVDNTIAQQKMEEMLFAKFLAVLTWDDTWLARKQACKIPAERMVTSCLRPFPVVAVGDGLFFYAITVNLFSAKSVGIWRVIVKSNFKFMNFNVIAISLCVACCAVHYYFVLNKESVHIDESLSFLLSTYNDYGYTRGFSEDATYSGDEIRKLMYSFSDTFDGIFDDIKKLRQTNRDLPHTNFYYSLLRLFLHGNPANMQNLLYCAGILNLCILICAFICVYFLSNKLFVTERAKVACLVLCFFSMASLSTTVFYRPYQLQMLFFLVSTCVFYKIYNDIKNEALFSSKLRKGIFVAFPLSLSLLSGYFSILFLFPLFAFLLYSAKNSQHRNVVVFQLFCIGILSLAFALLLYPNYLSGFFSPRASEAIMVTSSQQPINNVILSLKSICSLVSGKFVHFSGLIICVIAVIWFHKGRCELFWGALFVSAIFFAVVTMILAPYKILRYIMPIFPIFSLLIAKIFDSRRLTCTVALVLFGLVFSATTVFSRISEYYFPKDDEIFKENATLILGKTYTINALAPYLKGSYRIANDCKISGEDSVLFVHTSCGVENVGKDYRLVRDFSFRGFNVYQKITAPDHGDR